MSRWRAHLVAADAAEYERGGHRKRQAVLGLIGGAWQRAPGPQGNRFGKGFDGHVRDLVSDEAVLVLQRECGGDRLLRPVAHRVRLEVLLANAPAGTEIVPVRPCVIGFDRDSRGPGEALACQQRRADACERTPARTILDHRRYRTHTQDLAARSEIFGDAERMAHSIAVEPEQARADGGAGDSSPCPRTVVVLRGRVQHDTGARRDFVPQAKASDELRTINSTTCSVGAIEVCEQRREDGDADVSLGQQVPVVGVERIDRGRARKSRARDARPSAVEQHARAPIGGAHLRGREAVGDRRCRRSRSGGSHADQIQEAALGASNDVLREIPEPELARKLRYVGEARRPSRYACGFRDVRCRIHNCAEVA